MTTVTRNIDFYDFLELKKMPHNGVIMGASWLKDDYDHFILGVNDTKDNKPYIPTPDKVIDPDTLENTSSKRKDTTVIKEHVYFNPEIVPRRYDLLGDYELKRQYYSCFPGKVIFVRDRTNLTIPIEPSMKRPEDIGLKPPIDPNTNAPYSSGLYIIDRYTVPQTSLQLMIQGLMADRDNNNISMYTIVNINEIIDMLQNIYNNPNISSNTVSFDIVYFISGRDIQSTEVDDDLYLSTLDLVISIKPISQVYKHPFSSVDKLLSNYKDYTKPNSPSIVFELVDSKCRNSVRWVWAGYGPVMIENNKNSTLKDGVYVHTVNYDGVSNTVYRPLELAEELGFYKTKEEAETKGNPDTISKIKLEQEKRKILEEELRHKEEMKRIELELKLAAMKDNEEDRRYKNRTRREEYLYKKREQLNKQKTESMRLIETSLKTIGAIVTTVSGVILIINNKRK